MTPTNKRRFTVGGMLALGGLIAGIAATTNGVWSLLDHILNLFSNPWVARWHAALTIAVLAVLVLVQAAAYMRLKARNKRGRVTIALLLPLDNARADAKRDGRLQLNGVIEFLKKESDLTQLIHLKIFDHCVSNNDVRNLTRGEQEALRINRILRLLDEEYDRGTRYFFCTMSQVCEPLVPKFTEWAKQKRGGKPRLLCSVAAAPLDLSSSFAFRYYPRSIDEVELLVEWMRRRKITRVIPIEINSRFGEKTREQLDDECAGDPAKVGIKKLTGEETVGEIQEFLRDQINRHKGADPDSCFFLVLYGESLTKTVKALNAIEEPLRVLSVSTLTTEFTNGNVFSPSHEWVTCVPRLHGGRPFSADVISYFVYASLRRYAKAIVHSEERKESFRDVWVNNVLFPPGEDIDWQVYGQGVDSKIRMLEKAVERRPG